MPSKEFLKEKLNELSFSYEENPQSLGQLTWSDHTVIELQSSA